MSRPKSQKTIDLEAERAERRKRREVKQALKDRRRVEREKRRLTHERAVNGGPIVVKPEVDNFNYTGSRNYNPMCFCDTCHRMVRQNLMATDNECIDCRAERKSK